AWWMPAVPTLTLGAGAFLCEASLAAERARPAGPGDERWIASGGDWRAQRSDAWQEIPRRGIGAAPIEVLDARRLPADWQGPDFDDSTWEAAVELGAFYIGTSG